MYFLLIEESKVFWLFPSYILTFPEVLELRKEKEDAPHLLLKLLGLKMIHISSAKLSL